MKPAVATGTAVALLILGTAPAFAADIVQIATNYTNLAKLVLAAITGGVFATAFIQFGLGYMSSNPGLAALGKRTAGAGVICGIASLVMSTAIDTATKLFS